MKKLHSATWVIEKSHCIFDRFRREEIYHTLCDLKHLDTTSYHHTLSPLLFPWQVDSFEAFFHTNLDLAALPFMDRPTTYEQVWNTYFKRKTECFLYKWKTAALPINWKMSKWWSYALLPYIYSSVWILFVKAYPKKTCSISPFGGENNISVSKNKTKIILARHCAVCHLPSYNIPHEIQN